MHQQVVEVLRKWIKRGELSDPLPSEASLATSLQVSRPVLRQAFRQLAGEGLIVISKGKLTRLARRRQSRLPRSRLRITAISPQPQDASIRIRRGLIDQIRDELISKNYRWDELNDFRLRFARGTAHLDDYLETNPCDCLLLNGSNEVMQKWASQQSTPSMILGSSLPGISLPSVDSNYHALGWHAAGRLAAAGRFHVAIFFRTPLRPGDQAAITGLRSFYESRPLTPFTISLNALDGDVETSCRRMEKLLRGSNRPDAFFVLYPADAITALTYLLRSGKKIPAEIALISRESLPLMTSMVPELTRYESNERRLIRQTVQTLEKLCHHQSLPQTTIRVLPRYLKGQTTVSFHE